MIKKIRVLLVDDQALFREALRTLLSYQEDLEVVAEASNGEEAVRYSIQERPDVILMDLQMPVLSGVDATQRIRAQRQDVQIIALTTFDDDELIIDAFRAGAIGYLLKDVPSEKLFDAVRSAARGEYFLSPSIMAKLVTEVTRAERLITRKPGIDNPLSRREREILMHVAEGLSNREIAEKLVISEGTVKNHLSNILAKLESRDRGHAVIRAREAGFI